MGDRLPGSRTEKSTPTRIFRVIFMAVKLKFRLWSFMFASTGL